MGTKSETREALRFGTGSPLFRGSSSGPPPVRATAAYGILGLLIRRSGRKTHTPRFLSLRRVRRLAHHSLHSVFTASSELAGVSDDFAREPGRTQHVHTSHFTKSNRDSPGTFAG